MPTKKIYKDSALFTKLEQSKEVYTDVPGKNFVKVSQAVYNKITKK